MTIRQRHPISNLLGRTSLNILGVNTGTSMDALDMCVVRIIERDAGVPRVKPLAHTTVRFPARLRHQLWALANGDVVSKATVSRVHMEFGEWVGEGINRAREGAKIPKSLHAIAFHGQTIGHFPARRNRRQATSSAWQGDASWQLGSPAAVAQRTGVVTIGDFRASDVAAGGMGAPLSGYYHTLLFGEEHAVLNLGGIANISVARRRRRQLEILAFDIGPANMILDALAQRLINQPYDRNGALAARGQAVQRVLRRALTHPYFKKSPPKTCGREEFGEKTLKSWLGRQVVATRDAPDLLATAVQITAEQIGRSITRWVEPYSPVRSLLLAGGGTRNKSLVSAIEARLDGWRVTDTSTLGIDPQYVEAAGFALLAHETIRGRAGNYGGATGGQPTTLGSISIPIK